MRNTEITIIHHTDPLGLKVGGGETFIKGFTKYAPEDFNIDFIGISSGCQKYPLKKWTKLKLGNKEFNFFPLFFEKDENKKTLIPLSLRFTLTLKFFQMDASKKVLFFNRIEPVILFKRSKFPKVGIVHIDIQKYLEIGKSEVLWNKFPWLYLMFENLIFTSLDCIYTVSGNTLKFYQSKYPKQKAKFSFLPTYVDTEIFFPTDEPKFSIRKKVYSVSKSLPIENKWILFVGRLQKQKSPIRLIDTFLECYKRDKNFCLIIIGEGNLRKVIEKYIRKLDIENNVFLLGNMDQKALVDFYRASDVLLLTSNFEGMPICVLEALSCGLPVVSTDVSEVKRVIKSEYSGEVVKSNSPEVIAQTIGKVLANPSMYTKENSIKSISGYTPHEILKPVYELIRKLYIKKCVQ